MRAFSLRQQISAFDQGAIVDSDGNQDDRCYNFYDWFCKDSSLEKKAVKLFKNVKSFVKARPDIDLDSTYVFFKNNCPVNGNLYDSFSICDRKTGDVLFWVTPKSGHKCYADEPAQMYDYSNRPRETFKQAKNFRELLKIVAYSGKE